uniref:Uncharacterized protein n=1 Tax=Gloeothece verrucosa (strain PCC 7822) TaxID=497965 RepID=E0UGL5_GLOV7|nr:hypothetical protein Cyan7822_1220 [Gloeothece verrucosa PCC 7822]
MKDLDNIKTLLEIIVIYMSLIQSPPLLLVATVAVWIYVFLSNPKAP